jgi:hypothetical protein
MNKRHLLLATIIGVMLAGLTVPDLIADTTPELIRFPGSSGRPMEVPGVYPRIYSGTVEFQHEKHFSADGSTCGDCHHADDFEPDTDPDEDVEITNCNECHYAEGLVYGRRADEMDEDELLEHRANVMHIRCVGCHEEKSAQERAIVAPIACRGCHAQRQADYQLTE